MADAGGFIEPLKTRGLENDVAHWDVMAGVFQVKFRVWWFEILWNAKHCVLPANMKKNKPMEYFRQQQLYIKKSRNACRNDGF